MVESGRFSNAEFLPIYPQYELQIGQIERSCNYRPTLIAYFALSSVIGAHCTWRHSLGGFWSWFGKFGGKFFLAVGILYEATTGTLSPHVLVPAHSSTHAAVLFL